MNKLKSILLRAGLVALLAATLYACGSEAPLSTTPSSTTLPINTPTSAPAQTPTLAANSSNIEASIDISGTLFGLPSGAFLNSEAEKFQPTLPQPLQFQGPNPLGDTNLGVPNWIKPGTRITFYDAASTSGAVDPDCTPDPNGEWQDQNGDSYTCAEAPDNTEDNITGGDGLSQIDVLAVEGSNVVLASTMYSYDHASSKFVMYPSGGWKVAGDVIDGLWIHPTRLAEMARMESEDTTILTGDIEIGEAIYNVVSFVTKKVDSYSSYAYGTKTGLLVSATTKTTQAGKTNITIRRLRGYRQRNIPGMNGTNPAWVAHTKQLNYNGTWNFTNPMGPGDETVTYPISLTLTLDKGGKNWVPYNVKTVIRFPSYNQESKGSGVTGSGGQYWVDPKALAALKKGQVIDQDPYTEEELVVSSIVNSGTTKKVIISSDLPGYESLLTYDRTSGALIDLKTTSSLMGVTILLKLQNPPR